MLEFTVDQCSHGQSLRAVLRKQYHVSTGFLRRLQLYGDVLVNGQPHRLIDPVWAGDLVQVYPAEKPEIGVAPEPLPLSVVFRDGHVLVVDKPAGMVVHPARRHTGGTLANAVAYYLAPERERVAVRPVHRLDAGTSGLIVFACHAHAHAVLSRSFGKGSFHRRYLAVTAGVPPVTAAAWAEVCEPIARVPDHPVKRMVSAAGKEAITRYRVLAVAGSEPPAALVELELGSGRTHQVRVHMSHLGCPLWGDELYGGPPAPGRPALHAYWLEFIHPVTGAQMEFSAAMPDDMARLTAELGLTSLGDPPAGERPPTAAQAEPAD